MDEIKFAQGILKHCLLFTCSLLIRIHVVLVTLEFMQTLYLSLPGTLLIDGNDIKYWTRLYPIPLWLFSHSLFPRVRIVYSFQVLLLHVLIANLSFVAGPLLSLSAVSCLLSAVCCLLSSLFAFFFFYMDILAVCASWVLEEPLRKTSLHHTKHPGQIKKPFATWE